MNEEWTKGMCAGAKLSARNQRFSQMEKVINKVGEATEELRLAGLKEQDLLYLIQKHCKPLKSSNTYDISRNKPTLEQIRLVMGGMESLSDFLFPKEKMKEDKKKALKEVKS